MRSRFDTLPESFGPVLDTNDDDKVNPSGSTIRDN